MSIRIIKLFLVSTVLFTTLFSGLASHPIQVIQDHNSEIENRQIDNILIPEEENRIRSDLSETRSNEISDSRAKLPDFKDYDWYIDDELKYQDKLFVLKGNLTINASGGLTLINSTIIFDSDENNTYGLYIKANGSLVTTDSDGDPSTINDYSLIKANPSENRTESTYIFHAMSGSNLQMERTKIDFGTVSSDANSINSINQSQGILVENDDSKIWDCDISNSQIGIIYNRISKSQLVNVTFNNITNINVVFLNSFRGLLFNVTIAGSSTGIQIEHSTFIDIYFTQIQSKEYGVRINDSYVGIFKWNKIFNANTTGIELINSDIDQFGDSEISSSDQGLAALSSNISAIYDSIFSNNRVGMNLYESYLWSTYNVSFIDSEIRLFDESKMYIDELKPLPPASSEYWDGFEVDDTSFLEARISISLSFSVPEDVSYPFMGKYIIFDSNNNYVLNSTIPNRQSEDAIITLEPMSIGNYTQQWFDPFRIELDSMGYFLNETFSIKNQTFFDFTLAFNSAPELKSGRVTPDRGFTDTFFEFYVEYFDADGDEPVYVHLFLSNRTYIMNRFEGTANPKTGIQYHIEFYNIEEGGHDYYFVTDDGRNYPNSRQIREFDLNIDVIDNKKDKDEEGEESGYMLILLTICFVMVFMFVIFIIGLNYFMQKKLKASGGVEPGTLPEDLKKVQAKETIRCSECGEEIGS
ncbi:MAG: hypothetical protein ACW991_08840, partial [Candidatus Hodarchaeales archaeon]